MVTLSVTPSRVAGVLHRAVGILRTEGWDPLHKPIVQAIDRAAGYIPGKGGSDAERTTLDAWQALVDHLAVASVSDWERTPGRTELQVLTAVGAAADRAVTR